MRRVKFKEDIEAHPHGRRETFTKGQEVDVAEAFAKLVVDKGHATYVDGDENEKQEVKEEVETQPEARRTGRRARGDAE